ncbi:MAG: chorismate mutase [Candidatus Hodarchaeota archaeon]
MKENDNFEKELEKLRKDIDKIDNKIIELLGKRGIIAQKIGTLKRRLNKDIFQPQREKEIIEGIKRKSTVLKAISVEAIWREIIDACKLIQ